ncbi:MAG: glycosyltransferase [Clostridiales Family XIII bacterium]|jgi:glycosyltransferase involved in cell wall biosynthesis|nr:glycosyltransferase [Clostridiales Family XIII bacterium]
MNPKVSIIIPVYNGSNYLNKAIDSALAQDYDNFEVIVVNDGSNDDLATEKISLSYGDKIKYHSKENNGVASAWNKGIELSSGDFITLLSHDDLFTKNKISCQIKNFLCQNDPNCIIYSNWVIIDDNGEEKRQIILPNLEQKKFFLYYLLNQSLHGCTLLIPKKLFELEGNFNERLLSTCDYDFILRAARTRNFILCPEILVKGRKHKEQYTFKILTHNEERQFFFVNNIQYITRDMLNNSFSINDQTKYLYSLFIKLSKLKYSTAMLNLLSQITQVYANDKNIAMSLIYMLVNELSKNDK